MSKETLAYTTTICFKHWWSFFIRESCKSEDSVFECVSSIHNKSEN